MCVMITVYFTVGGRAMCWSSWRLSGNHDEDSLKEAVNSPGADGINNPPGDNHVDSKGDSLPFEAIELQSST